jgi:fatty acid desaturase
MHSFLSSRLLEKKSGKGGKMRKGEIIRNWVLLLTIISIVGLLLSYFVNWQWGLGISLGLFFGLIILLGFTMAGINKLSHLMRIGTGKGYLIQKKQ